MKMTLVTKNGYWGHVISIYVNYKRGFESTPIDPVS